MCSERMGVTTTTPGATNETSSEAPPIPASSTTASQPRSAKWRRALRVKRPLGEM